MKKFWQTMTFKLFVSILTMSLVFFIPLTLLSVFFFNKYMESMEHQIIESAENTSLLVTSATRYSMLKNDRKAIDKILVSLKDTAGIEGLRIYGHLKNEAK